MEILENAIQKGELRDFLMGRKAYFVRDRDWGGHDDSHTTMLFERYLKSENKVIDKNVVFKLIDNEYISILEDIDLNIHEYVSIIGSIHLYFIWKMDYGFDIEWNISRKLKNEILRLKPFFESQESIFTSQISSNLQIIKNKSGFTLEGN